MRKLLIVFLLLVIHAYVFFGNSSIYIAGRGGVLIPLKDNNLHMREEKICIDVHKFMHSHMAKYTCEFLLENSSGDRNILIGFPLSFGFTEDSMTNFDIGYNDIYDFSVKVNNAYTPYKIYIHGINTELDRIPQYDEVYAFSVFFKSGEKKKILIEYDMHPSFSPFGSIYSVHYILMSAHTMKGPIGKANISIGFHFPTEDIHPSIEGYSTGENPENVVSYYFENFSPQKDLTISYREKDRFAGDWDDEERPNNDIYDSHLDFLNAAFKMNKDDSSFSELFEYYTRAVSRKAAFDPSLENAVVSECSNYIKKIIDDPAASFLHIQSIANIHPYSEKITWQPLIDQAKKKEEQQKKAIIEKNKETLARIYDALEANPGDPVFLNSILLAYAECKQYKIELKTEIVRKYLVSMFEGLFEKKEYDRNEVCSILTVLPEYEFGLARIFSACIESHIRELKVKKDRKKAEALSRILQFFLTAPKSSYNPQKDMVAYNMITYRAKRGVFGNKIWFLREEVLREKDLMRKAFYTLGNYYFGTDFESAIKNYGYSFCFAQYGIFLENTIALFNADLRPDPKDLLTKNLRTWEREDENEAPAYYIAYNTCCAYARLGKIDVAFDWLVIALRLDDGKIKATAEKDTDLKVLREKYGDRFREIMDKEPE